MENYFYNFQKIDRKDINLNIPIQNGGNVQIQMIEITPGNFYIRRKVGLLRLYDSIKTFLSENVKINEIEYDNMIKELWTSQQKENTQIFPVLQDDEINTDRQPIIIKDMNISSFGGFSKFFVSAQVSGQTKYREDCDFGTQREKYSDENIHVKSSDLLPGKDLEDFLNIVNGSWNYDKEPEFLLSNPIESIPIQINMSDSSERSDIFADYQQRSKGSNYQIKQQEIIEEEAITMEEVIDNSIPYNIFLAGFEGSITQISTKTLEVLKTYTRAHKGSINSITSISIQRGVQSEAYNKGYIFTGGLDRTLKQFSIKNRQMVYNFGHVHKNSITAVAITSDGQYLFVADSGGYMKQLSIKDKKLVRDFKKAHDDSISSIVVTSDNEF